MESASRKSFNIFNLTKPIRKVNFHKVIIFNSAMLLILYAGMKNYIFFHSTIETLNTAVCFGLSIIAINTYRISCNNYFTYLGIMYGFASSFNFLHAAAFAGIFSGSKDSINISLQFNIIYRLMEGFSLITSFIFLHKKIKPYLVFYCYALSSIFLVYIIVDTNLLPDFFVYGSGLTSFENKCEHIIIFNMIVFIYLLIKSKNYFSTKITFYMSIYALTTISIRFVTIYTDSVYNDFSFIAHILKFISYYFLYKALVAEVLNTPFDMLFRKLNMRNLELKLKAFDLEKAINKLNEEKFRLEEIKKELEISKEMYKRLLEFLPDAVILRTDDKIIFANNSAVKLFGAENQKELVGKSPADLTYEEYLEDLNDRLDKQRRGVKNSFDFVEYRLTTLDGRIIDVELKTCSIIIKEENLFITVIYDVSERKKAEKTARLLNEARENERLRTEFFANLSHEFRTPLNVIYSALQVMDIKFKDETMEKYNFIIKQNCHRLSRLTNNIIDSTKISSGFLKLNLSYSNIVSAVEDISLSVSSYIESKDMTLIFDTEVEEKYLDFDPEAIEKVILNILSNAVKFGRGNGTIFVNVFDRKDVVTISIKDNGIGIPKDQQPFVFDRFKQVDKSFTRNREGSGIGLGLVKSLIELHEGTITLISEEGFGSEFIIELPVTEFCKDYSSSTSALEYNLNEKVSIEFSDIYS